MCASTYRRIYVPTRHTSRDPHAQSGTFGHAFSFGMQASALRTAAPGHVESEITSLGRGGDIWIRTERELAVDTIPNEDEDHRAEEFRPGLPDTLSGVPTR